MIVVPVTAATASATAIVPRAKASISNTPMGPFQTTVPGSRRVLGKLCRRTRADVEAHAVADRHVGDGQRLGGHVGVECSGHHVIHWQQQWDVALGRAFEQASRLVEFVGLNQRPANRQVLGLEERVGHRAADQQAVHLR